MDELNLSIFNEDDLFFYVSDYLEKHGRVKSLSHYYFFPAIFAGVFTGFLDENAEMIFTGDAVYFK